MFCKLSNLCQELQTKICWNKVLFYIDMFAYDFYGWCWLKSHRIRWMKLTLNRFHFVFGTAWSVVYASCESVLLFACCRRLKVLFVSMIFFIWHALKFSESTSSSSASLIDVISVLCPHYSLILGEVELYGVSMHAKNIFWTIELNCWLCSSSMALLMAMCNGHLFNNFGTKLVS